MGTSCSWSTSLGWSCSVSGARESQVRAWKRSSTAVMKVAGSSLVAQSCSRNMSASTIELQKWHWM